ncbi:hypothetical protein Pmani_006623 [Petrolisthes manimaculis]|uniref:Uncharacterized protein n=1 Tax=Petrolisthes manimaculis TaxID=1843537 RepID=A0AAE1QAA1_9EUCA|nr:hypothetical protein Pmani_006623 [Petrolisthes manimaculis]
MYRATAGTDGVNEASPYMLSSLAHADEGDDVLSLTPTQPLRYTDVPSPPTVTYYTSPHPTIMTKMSRNGKKCGVVLV